MLTDRIGRGRDGRAVFAADPGQSRGRVYNERPSPTRTEFQRDRDRIIHSTAFRRLKDKTQVFLFDEGDHYRTRLTHTIEVAQIARALARALHLDEDLAEALALAHDLGHPPFGHAGERALDAAMGAHGGFDHNAQGLRVVTELERRYPAFDGLNLSWETLEGLVKHNGPLTDAAGNPVGRYRQNGIPFAIEVFSAAHDLRLSSRASAEAQAAAIADDIAYDAHDIDDGLRAGLLTLEHIGGVDLLAAILRDVRAEHPAIQPDRLKNELTRRLITGMIEDVIGESLSRLDRLAPRSADDVRGASAPVIAFSAPFADADAEIKAMLNAAVYRHPQVMDVMNVAEGVVRRLFSRYLEDLDALPVEWRMADRSDGTRLRRRIADFLAGMTDRYALAEHERLFGEAVKLR